MSKNFFIFLLPLWLMISCTNSGEVPKGIIPVAKMTDLLEDMLLADAFANNYIIKDSTIDLKKANAKEYEKIFALHHVSKEEFSRSYEFYAANTDLSKTIFDSIYSRLSTKRFVSPLPVIKPIQDSAR